MAPSADTLPVLSRAFFERSKLKCTVALLVMSSTVMILGFCSFAAGMAQATNIQIKNLPPSVPQEILVGVQDYAGGAGFAAFCFIIAFFILLVGGVYYAPLLCGSANEKKMLRSPFDLEAPIVVAPNPSAPPSDV